MVNNRSQCVRVQHAACYDCCCRPFKFCFKHALLVLQGFDINFVTWQHCGLGCPMYIPMVRPNPVC